MNHRLAFVLVLASVACEKDTASTTPADPGAVASTPTTPSTTTPPATDPAPADPGTGATDAEAPIADPEPDTIPTGPVGPVADPAEGLTEAKDFAQVKLELKQPNKKVYKDPAGKILDWDTPTRIDVDFDDHKHAFVLTAKRSGKTGVTVEIDYTLDGTEVLRSADLATKLKERGVLLVEGGAAIAVTVVNKRVKPKPAPAKDTIVQPGGKDPLAGAEKTKG